MSKYSLSVRAMKESSGTVSVELSMVSSDQSKIPYQLHWGTDYSGLLQLIYKIKQTSVFFDCEEPDFRFLVTQEYYKQEDIDRATEEALDILEVD